MLAVNALLLRAAWRPLDALTALMQRVDLLRPATACRRGNGDLADLIETFNAMLDRLEAERSFSTAHVLAAQEAERQRIAQELHDEIGQSLTVVLLGLKRVVDRAPASCARSCSAVQETARVAGRGAAGRPPAAPRRAGGPGTAQCAQRAGRRVLPRQRRAGRAPVDPTCPS